MADVTISYKGNEIATMNATGVKTLLTGSMYCEDDITVSYTKPAAPIPSLQAKTNINPTTSSQTISPDVGYDGLSSVQINAMPSGSAATPATTITANPTISVNASGLITASVSKTQSVTPTVSAGYVSSGTAGTVTVSGSNTSQLTAKAAATYTPTTSAQTIAAGQYLTGAQTISGDANLIAGNIKDGVSIFGVNGSYQGGGVQLGYVDGLDASGILYYTDSTMTVQSGYGIYGEYLPIGTLIFIYNDGPAPPLFPTGVTHVNGYQAKTEFFDVWEVTG